MHQLPIAAYTMLPIASITFWSWLLRGLRPPDIIWLAFFVVVATAGLLYLLGELFRVTRIPRLLYDFVFVILLAPLIEELTCRIFLVGVIMMVFWPCAAPQTTVLCGILFGLMHIPTAVYQADPLRVLDGLIIGFFNTIACLVYLRVFLLGQGIELWFIVYGALVLPHVGYNALACFCRLAPFLRLGLRVGGVLFAVGAWIAWMPRLV